MNLLVLGTTSRRLLHGRPWACRLAEGHAHAAGHGAAGRRGGGAESAGGSRRHDANMRCTARRPIAAGRIGPTEAACCWAAILAIAGAVELMLRVNVMTAALGAATFVSYVFIYTPLKPYHHTLHDSGRDSPRAADGHGLDGCQWRPPAARTGRPASAGGGIIRHPLFLAASAFPGHRDSLQRGLRAGRLQNAARRR